MVKRPGLSAKTCGAWRAAGVQRTAGAAADFFGLASDAQPALVVVKALDAPFAGTLEGGFLVSDGTDYGSFEHPGTNLIQEMFCIDLVVCSVPRNSAAMPLPGTKMSFSSAFGFREQHFLGAAVCSALVCFFTGANAAAQTPGQRRLSHGPLFAAELHVSTLQWVDQFEGNVASGNRIAKLDVEDSVRTAAFGGAARFGWSLKFHEVLALVPRLQLVYASSQRTDVVYRTEAASYELSASADWMSATLGAELQLVEWFAMEAGIGGGLVKAKQPYEGARRASTNRPHYVLALGLRLRFPRHSSFGGYVGLGHEMLGLSPMRAFWEGRWVVAGYSMLRVGFELDAARGKDRS